MASQSRVSCFEIGVSQSRVRIPSQFENLDLLCLGTNGTRNTLNFRKHFLGLADVAGGWGNNRFRVDVNLLALLQRAARRLHLQSQLPDAHCLQFVSSSGAELAHSFFHSAAVPNTYYPLRLRLTGMQPDAELLLQPVPCRLRTYQQ